MKRIVTLTFALVALVMSVSAQQTRTTAKKPEAQEHHGKKEMMKGVNITKEQKGQLKAIKQDQTLSKEDKKAKMSSIFTADQKAKIAQNRSEMQAKGEDGHAQKAKEMKEKLGLSDDQAAKLKDQSAANHAQAKAIRDDQTLSADAKKEKIKALRSSAQAQRAAVLSPDQQKKMDDFKKENKGKHKKHKDA